MTFSYGSFVAKIYDYALSDSFWGSAGFLDSLTSYATLVCCFKSQCFRIGAGWSKRGAAVKVTMLRKGKWIGFVGRVVLFLSVATSVAGLPDSCRYISFASLRQKRIRKFHDCWCFQLEDLHKSVLSRGWGFPICGQAAQVQFFEFFFFSFSIFFLIFFSS